MPPLVARQWNVLRGPRSAPAHFRCLLRISRHAAAGALRPYSQASTNNGDRSKLRTTNSAIIIPASAVNIQPEDLISHITPVARQRLTQDRFAVFLVTPTFAQWLLDDTKFLQKALSQAYRHMLESSRLPYVRVHALCAVVDKLPKPNPIVNSQEINGDALPLTIRPPIGETGFEGLTYATLPFSDSLPIETHLVNDNAAISFVSLEGSASDGYFGDVLRLPVANTVFQTGSPTTMAYSTWETDKETRSFTLKSKQNVIHHGIKIHTGGASNQCISHLAVPLLPLTFPRQVDASMGNILRRVIGSDGKSITASQELEQVVPQYHNARGELSQATTVWALVVSKGSLKAVLEQTDALLGLSPHDEESSVHEMKASTSNNKQWESLWKREPPLWNELVPRALAAGGRLHRVLSGGGGWGKRAGLLSLDPVATVGDVDSGLPNMSEDGPGDLSSALQQVAHDGDYIQFFISPSSPSAEAQTEDRKFEKLRALTKSTTPWAWEFGTIPSTVDSIPGDSRQHNDATSKDMVVFRKSFGALSEGGMIVDRRFKRRSKDAFSLIGGSKVDVPFSRFSAMNVGDADPAEQDSMNNCLKAKILPYHSVLVRRLYGEESPAFLNLSGSGPHLKPNRTLLPPKLDTREPKKPSPPSKPSGANSQLYSEWSNIPRWVTRGPENAPLKITHVQTDVASAPNGRSPDTLQKEDNIISYRTYGTVRNEVLYCNDKLRQTQKRVQALTDEFRMLMVSRRQRTGQTGFSFLKTKEGQLSREAFEERQERQAESLLATQRRRVTLLEERKLKKIRKKLEIDVEESDVRLNALQTEVQELYQAATDDVFDQLTTRVSELTEAIASLRKQLALNIGFRTRIIQVANTSALDVYNLHISLRWRLGLMVMARQRHRHPHPMARSIMPLEKKLVKLRGYTSNLFYDRPGLDDSIIRQTLGEMESNHNLIKNLQLSEAAQRVERKNKLGPAAQEEMRANAAKRRALKGQGLKANAKIRRVIPKLIIDTSHKRIPAESLPEQSATFQDPIHSRARYRRTHIYRSVRLPDTVKRLNYQKIKAILTEPRWRREHEARAIRRFRRRYGGKAGYRGSVMRMVRLSSPIKVRKYNHIEPEDRIRLEDEAIRKRSRAALRRKNEAKEALLRKVANWLDGGNVRSDRRKNSVFGAAKTRQKLVSADKTPKGGRGEER